MYDRVTLEKGAISMYGEEGFVTLSEPVGVVIQAAACECDCFCDCQDCASGPGDGCDCDSER